MSEAIDIFRAIRDGNISAIQAALEAVPAAEKPAWFSQESSGMRNTPLLTAISIGNIDIVRLFVEAGADLTVRNASGNTVLHNAAQKGNNDILRFLLSHAPVMALINENNSGERTPLSLAARDGHRETVEILLEHGATVTYSDIEVARERGHDAIADLISQKFAKPLRWAGAQAPQPASDPGVFLLAGGHGSEDFDNYDIVPPGRTLITMTKCGSMVFNKKMFEKLAAAFTSDMANGVKHLFLDIKRYVAGIEDFLEFPRGTFRVYSEGERCPRLFFMPVDIQHIPGYTVYNKSGVYKLPSERDDLFKVDGAELHQFVYPNTTTTDDEKLDLMYRGSVYPTVGGAQGLFHGVNNNLHMFDSLMITPMTEIMEHLGFGVYLFAVCRSGRAQLNVESFIVSEYYKNPDELMPYVIDVPGRFAEIKEKFKPKLAHNTEARIAAIMTRRARSSSERRRRRVAPSTVRKLIGGGTRRVRRQAGRSTRKGSSYKR